MTIAAEYFGNLNFIKTSVSHVIDDQALLAHIEELNAISHGVHSVLELADCRGVTDFSHLSEEGAELCASQEKDKPGSRLAILIPSTDNILSILGDNFEALSEKFRESVVVLYDLDEAISWLTDDPKLREAIKKLY